MCHAFLVYVLHDRFSSLSFDFACDLKQGWQPVVRRLAVSVANHMGRASVNSILRIQGNSWICLGVQPREGVWRCPTPMP